MVDLANINLAGVSNTTVNVTIIVIAVVLAIALAIGVTLSVVRYRKWKQYRCIIFYRDGFGQMTAKYDQAAVFVDSKTNNKRLFLRKHNVGLSPDNIPFIRLGKEEFIFLLQTGLKNFQYIDVKIGESGTVTLNVGEEDINWAANSYERAKKLFTSSMLLQYMPYIALFFVSIIILVIFIYFFKGFASLKDMAEALRDAMGYVVQAKSGTTILPGG